MCTHAGTHARTHSARSQVRGPRWHLAIRVPANENKKGPKGATLALISRRGQSEGVTPPIDQRPSSFLLSFLQFVNFLNRGVDLGRAAAALWQLSISVSPFG